MTDTEAKKYLLRQKPTASLMYIRQAHAYYQTMVKVAMAADELLGIGDVQKQIVFKIPVDDMGSTDFLPEMPGQSLNRWIYLPEN